ncbi:MAG TPA: acyl-CoA dehydrogenase family protein [Oscillatoriaceae cyanobacterium]
MLDYQTYLSQVRRNAYEADPAFRAHWLAGLPETWRAWSDTRARQVGALAATRWTELGQRANENPPKLHVRNAWGEDIYSVEVHPDYDQLAREAYEAGVVWPRFNAHLNGGKAPWSVVFGLGYLFGQAEQGMFCPICLTAGTAWLLERFGDEELKRRYLTRVASPDYDQLLEGAMFLTEREGGSDVGAARCEARMEGGQWRLYGDKWFASNAGRAGAMMVLARPQGAAAGTRGLGLFLVPRELGNGERNAIRIHRLKDKLGTRSMPSGELTFEGAIAYPVGAVEHGFAQMAEMLNLSRLYNAVGSISNMRRVLRTAIAYQGARSAFGHAVDQYPMAQAQLIEQTIEQEAATRITFETIGWLDRVEAGNPGARGEKLLRVLTPMIKYHTARASVDMASWGAEALGGNGYIEEWPMARYLRDAQVLPIWEGTTNILVLDVLRSFAKEGTGPVLLAELGNRLEADFGPALAPWREALAREVADAEQQLLALLELDDAGRTCHAKAWCDRMVRLTQGVLLLETAAQELAAGRGRAVLVLAHFLRRHFAPGDWRERMRGPSPALGYEAIVHHAPISADAAIALLREGAPALR